MKFTNFLTETASTKFFADELITKQSKIRNDYINDLAKQIKDIDGVTKVDIKLGRLLSENLFLNTWIIFEYKGIKVKAQFTDSGYSLAATCTLGQHSESTIYSRSLKNLFKYIDQAIVKLERK